MAVGKRMLIKDPYKNIKIDRLKALGATTFTGTTDPADAKIWMDVLEKCFDEMGCPADRKVRLVTFLLQEGASNWWKSVRSKRLEPEVTDWSQFKKAFYEEYYPRSYRDAKQSEFLKLVQGSMSVAEYEKKYMELSKYATTIIKDEIDKCRRFEDGLEEEIRTCITAVEQRGFRGLVEAALRVERSISERKSQKQPSRNVRGFSTSTVSTHIAKQLEDDTKFVPGVARHETSKSKFFGNSNSSTTKQVTGSPISIVGPTSEEEKSAFSHQGQCLNGMSIYYNYGQSSHIKREYPLLMQRGNDLHGPFSKPEQSKVQVDNVATSNEPERKQLGTPRTHGKVFAMTPQGAKKLSE